ncbi:MAG: prolipoprotein diacylglyceryl transferase [Candidatus Melainabacteria bacterium HGW-Melainabacteria-1]|nr:MAG: prolipoprotein diacylglyceryl transferase [Candidatus Melainabacteria bacterium HGW-Melainabacteria-1]
MYLFISRNAKFIGMGKTKDDAMDLMTYGFIGVLAGGRLGYILFYNLPYYLQNPQKILFIWEGGMAFHGGLIGSILAVMLYARHKKIPLLTMWDIVALPAPLGLMCGRIGNFINGELWGKPTDGSWGVRFWEPIAGGNQTALGPPRHPTQLYEALLEGLLLFVLLWFASRSSRLKPGSIGALFLTGYGIARFAIEFNRLPDAHIGYLVGTDWLTMGHVLTLPMILGGLGMLLWCNRGNAPQIESMAEPDSVLSSEPVADPVTEPVSDTDPVSESGAEPEAESAEPLTESEAASGLPSADPDLESPKRQDQA